MVAELYLAAMAETERGHMTLTAGLYFLIIPD